MTICLTKVNKENGKVFKKGDIVWAKVRGYSWWPAKVYLFARKLLLTNLVIIGG